MSCPPNVKIILDTHSHILPGIDDGADSVETSLEMLRLERNQGIETVFLTPHFYPSKQAPDEFFKVRAEAFERLLEAVKSQPDASTYPTLRVGAEVAYYGSIGSSSELRNFAISGTNLVLIEMPFARWDDSVFQNVMDIRLKLGLEPIIAHIERYAHGNGKYVREFARNGILIQSNAEFFIEHPLKANYMLKHGFIQFIGSDAHNLNKRKPCIGEATSKICDLDLLLPDGLSME